MAARREKLTKLEKGFFVATALCGVILLGAPVWWLSLEVDPVVSIPAPPPLPKPNAYDYYVSASNSIIGTAEISYAIIEPGSRGSSSLFPTRLPNGTVLGRPFTQSEKESLLQQNAVALQTLRRGFRYRFQSPPQRSILDPSPHLPYRYMAQLIVLEGNVKAGRGNWNGAANSYLDALRFGSDIARGAAATGRGIAIMCESMGQRPLWGVINHLNAPQARAAARRLEQINKSRVPLSETLTREKWLGQSSLMEIFRNRDWRNYLISIYGMDQNGQQSGTVWAHSWMMGKRTVMRNYTKLIEESIAAARKPYSPSQNAVMAPEDLLANLTISFQTARFNDARSEAGSTLLTVALALRAYRLEHGAYPMKLDALRPRFLQSIPLDPFAAAIPLRYKRSGKEYTLYSVGPDAKDNGGKPILGPAGPSRSRAYYDVTSIGDVVPGSE